jgi:hypothetical protein
LEKNKRPNHYNYFNGGGGEKKFNYRKFGKILFKSFKFFFLFFLLVITIIGFVQGCFFVKISTKTGSGAELYSHRENITINVSSIGYKKENDSDKYYKFSFEKRRNV